MMRGNHYYKRIGERICRARKLRSYTQEELAFMSDIDRTYITRIERGKVNPSLRTLYKISRALKIGLRRITY